MAPRATDPFTFAPNSSKGRYSTISQPPPTPSPGRSATSSAVDRLSSGSRKRPRADSTRKVQGGRVPGIQRSTTSTRPLGGDGGGVALVNERYSLAGGFDTPSYQAAAANDLQEPTLEQLGRRTRNTAAESDGYFPAMPLSGPLARERNGNARIIPDQQSKEAGTSWAGYAVGLVSRVFNFGTGVIKGFYSGGGQGYNLAGADDAHRDYDDHPGCSTPVPGSWMEESEILRADAEAENSAASVHRPSNKRRQTDKDAWVMVSPSEGHKRRMSGNVVSRNSMSVRPPPASRAGSRRSLAPTMHRRQSSYTAAPTGSPAHDRRASFAPTRSPGSNYLSPEAERHVKRQAKQDIKINNISRQLEDLIRQGQEALGTKVSVEGMESDEGFAEDW